MLQMAWLGLSKAKREFKLEAYEFLQLVDSKSTFIYELKTN
jgi:hypothetical protein